MNQVAQLRPFEQVRLGIIGLGYVGLPLAVAFGKVFHTLGFDISEQRILELKQGIDNTLEVDAESLKSLSLPIDSDDNPKDPISSGIWFSNNPDQLSGANTFIVTVPTPIDQHKRPVLTPLIEASKMIAQRLNPGDVVVYESTVYPGATEEVCVPLLEAGSGLTLNQDFFVGYSPERINPGDTEHKVSDIKKVTSGSSPEASVWIDQLYKTIITAGTHLTSSIRVAEAAKVIENTQRDVNIALVNELAMLFNRLDIDTSEVLAAAGTKWNFLPFKPGLVGGHCISVDPYYLTHKAQEVGHHPDVILAGRRINDEMGLHVAQQVIQLLLRAKKHVVDANILILGLTFKENCPDLRNSRVIDVIEHLRSFHANINVHDPWINEEIAQAELGLKLTPVPEQHHYDAVVLCVAHKQFTQQGAEWIRSLLKPGGILYDVKSALPLELVDARL